MLFDPDGQIEDYTSISNQCPQSFSQIMRPFHQVGIDRTLFDVVSTIAVFASDLNTWYETGTCTVDAFDLQKHASLLMYRLFAWHERSTNNHHATRPIDRSICLALLIFMVYATEPSAASFGSRLSKTVTKLQQSLHNTPVLAWSNAPDLLLWTVTMGALGAKSLPNTSTRHLPYFKQHCRTAFAGHVPIMIGDLMQRMQNCLWIPSIFETRAIRLWTSMGLCSSEKMDMEDMSSTSSDEERDHIIDEEYALGQSTTMRFFTADKKGRRHVSKGQRMPCAQSPMCFVSQNPSQEPLL